MKKAQTIQGVTLARANEIMRKIIQDSHAELEEILNAVPDREELPEAKTETEKQHTQT